MIKMLGCATILCVAALQGASASPLTFTSVTGGIATGPNLDIVTFDPAGSLPSGVDLTLSNAAIVSGSVVNQYAAPYLSGGQGAFFGQANGPDATNYVAVGQGGAATFTFKTPQTYFGLLWGSIDSYNALSFYENGTLIGTISGNDVEAGASGDQGLGGTNYLNVFSSLPFDEVVAWSSGIAFEFDDVAFDPPVPSIPEPSGIAMLLAGLGFLTTVRGMRRARSGLLRA